MTLTMATVAAVTQINSSFIWSVLYLIFSVYLWSALNSPLKTFPGPILAANTNLWRLWDVYRGRNGETHLKLHRKHGSVVRIGPNVLSLSDPNLINRVYNAKSAWNKVSETVRRPFLKHLLKCHDRATSIASMTPRLAGCGLRLCSQVETRSGTQRHCVPSVPYTQ